MKPRHAAAVRQIGWREDVGLPDLGIPSIKAKIDTGARTSAIHAKDVAVIDVNGTRSVRFRVPDVVEKDGEQNGGVSCIAPLVDQRPIKNTSGQPEARFVIQTILVLGNRHWKIEVSLANRDEMGFPIILGRTAIRGHGLVVNPGRSFLYGAPAPFGATVAAKRK